MENECNPFKNSTRYCKNKCNIANNFNSEKKAKQSKARKNGLYKGSSSKRGKKIKFNNSSEKSGALKNKLAGITSHPNHSSVFDRFNDNSSQDKTNNVIGGADDIQLKARRRPDRHPTVTDVEGDMTVNLPTITSESSTVSMTEDTTQNSATISPYNLYGLGASFAGTTNNSRMDEDLMMDEGEEARLRKENIMSYNNMSPLSKRFRG